MVIVDILWLVGYLMIIRMHVGEEEHRRNAVLRVRELIAPVIVLVAVMEPEVVLLLHIHGIDDVAQFGRHAACTLHLEIIGSTSDPVAGVAAADHVDVDLRDDRIPRDRRMAGEPVRPSHVDFFATVPDEDDGPFGLDFE